jgi:polyhydroxyalkanoate synthesis regulator protein
MQSLQDMQAAMNGTSKAMSPEVWTQFMGLQTPAVQTLMNKNLEQSQQLFAQMQEQMQKQTEQMLANMGIKR